MKKAKIHHDESTDDPAEKEKFVASCGWLQKFRKRNGLSLRRRTTIAQRNQSSMIDKLVMYVVQNRRMQRSSNISPAPLLLWTKPPFDLI